MTYRLCCAVSGHGFGHLSQVAALVNRLAETVADLEIHVISSLSQPLLARILQVPFSLECRAQDVGLVQHDPMRVDRPATLEALRRLHDHWPERLEAEKRSLAAWKPDLLLADIPYLPIAAAAQLAIPTVAIASLSWDAVVSAYFLPATETGEQTDPEVVHWVQTMRQAYGRTTLALLPTPAIWENHPFPHAEPIGPLALPGHRHREGLRRALGIESGDDRPLILVSLGGIPARHLPVQALEREDRLHWLLDVPLTGQAKHLHSLSDLLAQWSFADLSASVDGVVSKPGYGMAVAATTQQIPFLYLRRGLFPDERPICAWMAEKGRALELTAEQFYGGDWFEPLCAVLAQPAKPPCPANGAEQGAERIRRWMA